MPTYSSSLRATLITSGTEAGTWGTTTNDNLDYVFDRSIAGYVEVVVASTNHVLTYNNGPVSDENLNQSICAILELTTSVVTTAFNVYAPPVSKQYIIWNNTAYTASLYNSASIGSTTPAGAAFTIAAGDRVLVWSDGTEFRSIQATSITGVLPTVNGGTGLSSFTANGVVYASSTSALATGSALTFDGTNLGVGTSSPGAKLDIGGTNNTVFFKNSGATTGYALATVSNTSGAFQYGISSSTGTFWGSGNAGNYSANIGTTSATNLGFGTSDTLRMLLDSSGNLGLGVTPSAWTSTYKAFAAGSVNSNFSGFWDGTTAITTVATGGAVIGGAWTYTMSGQAVTRYAQTGGGAHAWYTAPSGTAGNAITFTQAMTLDSSGRLYVGTTSGASAFNLSASSVNWWTVRASDTAGSFGTFYKGGTLTPVGYIGTDGGGIVGGGSGDNFGIRSEGALLLMAGATERARITSGGSFQIGSNSGSDPRLFVYDNDSTDAAIIARQDGAAPIQIWQGASASERARITSDGDLLVGTTSSNEVSANGFIVQGATKGYVATSMSQSTNSTYTYHVYSTGAGAYRFYVGLGGTVYATNTTISAISDQRLKENIQDLDAGLEAVMALKPRKFDWKAGKGKDIKGDRGWIAQEFEQVFPDLIDEWKDPAPEGEEPYKSVRADLIPVLVKAIQEQQALIESLTARIAALEAA